MCLVVCWRSWTQLGACDTDTRRPWLIALQGNHRKLRVPAQPNVTLSMRHLPARCRRARTLLLGPLMPADLDPASFVVAQPWWHALVGLPWQQVGLMAQGLQRQLDASGRVQPLRDPSPLLVDALGASTSVFLSDVETDTWPNTTVAQLAHRTSRFLVTRGKDGADEYVGCTAVTRHPVFQVSPEQGPGHTPERCATPSVSLAGTLQQDAQLCSGTSQPNPRPHPAAGQRSIRHQWRRRHLCNRVHAGGSGRPCQPGDRGALGRWAGGVQATGLQAGVCDRRAASRLVHHARLAAAWLAACAAPAAAAASEAAGAAAGPCSTKRCKGGTVSLGGELGSRFGQ